VISDYHAHFFRFSSRYRNVKPVLSFPEKKKKKKNMRPYFIEWPNVRRPGLAVDFRHILSVNSSLRDLKDYVVNISEFEEKSQIVESEGIMSEIYCRFEQRRVVVVKSNSHADWVEKPHGE
jgi:hypothetical protein